MKKILLLLSVGLATFASILGLYVTLGITEESLLLGSFFITSTKLVSTALFSGLLSVSTLLAGAVYPKEI